MLELNTFSIVARCDRTGELGVAVATAVPAVGAMCPFLRPKLGAASTQSWVNPYLAIDALNRMAMDESASDALAAVVAADERADLRQIGIVGRTGPGAAWTGENCTPWAGQRTGDGFAIQGNMLTGPGVLDAMVESFHASAGQDLAERLLRALEAGDAMGGDKRGRQSAALEVVAGEDYPLVDLRVDEHPRPVAELRRIHAIAQAQLIPFVAGMPKRRGRAGAIPEAVAAMLADPPPQRAGGGGSAPGPAGALPDLMREVIGLTLPPARASELLASFAPVLAEIEKLRALDLGALHPPILFDPTIPYRTSEEEPS